MKNFVLLFLTYFGLNSCLIKGSPVEPLVKGNPVEPTANYNDVYDKIPVVVVQVPFGETVTLTCRSNDKDHSFVFWHLSENNTIIGPVNPNLDKSKFKYDVLSGNLTVKSVSLNEAKLYNCVSRGVRNSNQFNVRSVRLVVDKTWDDLYEHDSEVNVFRTVVAITTLVLISGVAYAVYRIWKNRFRNPSYLVPSDEEEDDDSAEELFRAPGTSSNTQPIVRNHSNDAFDAPGISTDFTSILDTANRKS